MPRPPAPRPLPARRAHARARASLRTRLRLARHARETARVAAFGSHGPPWTLQRIIIDWSAIAVGLANPLWVAEARFGPPVMWQRLLAVGLAILGAWLLILWHGRRFPPWWQDCPPLWDQIERSLAAIRTR